MLLLLLLIYYNIICMFDISAAMAGYTTTNPWQFTEKLFEADHNVTRLVINF